MSIKKIIPLFAIALGLVLAVATSGFKENTKGSDALLTSWYEFNGDPSDINDVLDNTQYIYTSGMKPCNGSSDVCGVKAAGPTSANSHPNAFSQALQDELTAVFNGTASYADIAQRQ